MTERLDDLWSPRDYPVLREAVRLIDRGARNVKAETLAEATGLPEEEVKRAVSALARRGLVDPWNAAPGPIGIRDVSGEAYLITGLHPDGSDVIEQLVSVIRQASDRADSDEERTRLQRAASALADASGKILTGAATVWLTGAIPH
jgi:hypothetical protein